MSLMPRQWPTAANTNASSPLAQTAEVVFAWAYMAPFLAALPFFLAPPVWVAILSQTAKDDPPSPTAARRAR
jgi:hypothetical protein